MKARSIVFRDHVRTGPGVQDRKDRLLLSDAAFGANGSYACGTIEVDLKQRIVTVTSTRPDPQTKQPVVSVVPFDGMVTYFEPLTPAQAEIFYPTRKAGEAA